MTFDAGDGTVREISYITVAAYRRYCEIMARSEGLGKRDAAELMGGIIPAVMPGVPRRLIGRADAAGVWRCIKSIHFVMQDIIAPKFLQLTPEAEPVEYVGSVFDKYDEENGYNDIPGGDVNVWEAMIANTDQLVRFATKAMGESWSSCMAADICELLDYAKFEIGEIGKEGKK